MAADTLVYEDPVADFPATRKFPHGVGFEMARKYMYLRDQAESALDHGNAAMATKLAVRCLEEAAWLAHQATGRVTEAAQKEETLADVSNALQVRQQFLDTERMQLRREQSQFEDMRRRMEADQRDLRMELAAANARLREVLTEPPAWRKGRTTPQRDPGPVLPDHNATLRPDPVTAVTQAKFMEQLRQFRVWAGKPSYRNMAARDQRFTASALHAALSKNTIPTRHDMVDAIIAGCGGSDEDRSIWATAWRRLAMQLSSGVPIARVLKFPEPGDSAS